ncbi:hypothetical protein AMAG_20305 [Allomyces macrogynus ATCC 38327]|uniref:Uncharacterized protein n=1 Tax=Allomyces macrogynus (strain ATCC 38327) TaxID=578462 RepID=A0A0L0T7I7_ALLM3|nr:hypothetical protein AMAG_20305 [Allomyces macrogynus ATCC 38327]|eukprot:KNE70661.1 hypothetical protein AMAG_20305 [Allomyces macrogynus ATCC 38327]
MTRSTRQLTLEALTAAHKQVQDLAIHGDWNQLFMLPTAPFFAKYEYYFQITAWTTRKNGE